MNYLFREANSFARAKLEENCELQEKKTVSHKDKYPSISSSQMEAIVFFIHRIIFLQRAKF